MLEWILNIFKSRKDFFPGIILENNFGSNFYSHEEAIGVSATPHFSLSKPEEVESFPYQYQNGCSGCVAFSLAKIACVLYYRLTKRKVKFSPAFFYPRRLNKPGLGMMFSDATSLASEGNCLYDLLPCEGFTEEQMNNIKVEDYHKQSADAFALPKDWVNLKDFDMVAATIEKTGKPIMLWFEFGPEEFFGTNKPKVLGEDNRYRHSVVAIKGFTSISDGNQYIRIEDSADREKYYKKDIDREFFSKKIIKNGKDPLVCAYPRNFKFLKEKDIIIYDGTTKSMQGILQSLGFFPNDPTLLTGFWGGLTDNAVKEFCKEYGLVFKEGRKAWRELEDKLKTL